MSERCWYLFWAVLFLFLGIFNPFIAAVPDRDKPQPIDPSGVWEAYSINSLMYAVTIKKIDAVDKEIYWETEWRDLSNVVCYAGVLSRDDEKKEKFIEHYNPAVSAIGPWHLEHRGNGELDHYSFKATPGTWVLKRSKPDF